MPRGGYRPGAGHPKGAKKLSPTVEAAIADVKAGTASSRFTSALDFAMDVINDPEQPMEAKIRLAIAAMPFQHARLEAVTIGKKDQQTQVAEKRAKGRFAPPAEPGSAPSVN